MGLEPDMDEIVGCSQIADAIDSMILEKIKGINDSVGAFPEATQQLRDFFNQEPSHSSDFVSLTETPLRDIKRRGVALTGITQLAYEPDQVESILSNDDRTEVHGVNVLPSCSSLVRAFTGKNITGFRSFKISKTIHNELDLIAYEGKFKAKDFSDNRELAFKAEVESGGKTIFIRGYPRKEKILNVVYQPNDIIDAAILDDYSISVKDGTLFKFQSLNIPDNSIPKEILEQNMPYVVSSIAYNLGASFLYDTSFMKHLSHLATPGIRNDAFIYAFKDCELPSSNYFNGSLYFLGEVDLNDIQGTGSGNKVIPCSFKIVNPTQYFEYKIKVDLALVSFK